MVPSGARTQITTALSRMAVYFRTTAWQVAGGYGLTPTQLDILVHIARRGPTRGGALARSLGVTPATLSDSAGALAAKGLAERVADPQDARAILWRATASGVRLAADHPDAPPELATALDNLGPADQAAMLRALTRLILSLQEARAIPVQRMCATCRHFRPHVHDDADAPHHCAFVDAAFGDADLRIDCGDHQDATAEARARITARLDAVV